MNNETINYAYLAGFLESELKNLAYDNKFLAIKDIHDRRSYLNKLIKNANDAAKEYSAKMEAA